MSIKWCCARCFGEDSFDGIRTHDLDAQGDHCPYCNQMDVLTVHPKKLQDVFTLLATAYEPDAAGLPLAELLREDWSMFPHFDDANATLLLVDILDDGEIARKKYKRSYEKSAASIIESWEEFRQELMHANRYFPSTAIDVGVFEGFLPDLSCIYARNSKFYRARTEEGTGIIPVDKMGAPPKEKATHGRANPAGIPYLYVGSDEPTALAEIRPHPGEKVTVAKCSLKCDLTLINLTSPRDTISAFVMDDEFRVQQYHDQIGLLEKFGHELTRPVLPSAAAYNYTPSQYLCEFIKSKGFDGVIYSSSVGSGVNFAIFYPNTVDFESVASLHVDKILVQTTPPV